MLSGTPTAAGTASFTVNVTDSAGATLTQSYTLAVNTALKIAPGCACAGHFRDGHQPDDHVSGGAKPYTTFSISGFVAGTTGLTAANLTTDLRRELWCSPAHRQPPARQVHCRRHRHWRSDLTKTYSLTVNPGLSIAPAALAEATAGTATSQTITVSDGSKPYTTFSISGFSAGTTGLTAANLTTDATAGTVVLSGTPRAAGTASFTVNVTDTVGAILAKTYSLTVNPGLSIAPAALADATAGRATNQTITVSGGSKPYTTFTISGFSAGTTGLTAANLTTDATAGTVVLSGTPTAAGTASFTVDVTDTTGATLHEDLFADGESGLTISPAALAQATPGRPPARRSRCRAAPGRTPPSAPPGSSPGPRG